MLIQGKLRQNDVLPIKVLQSRDLNHEVIDNILIQPVLNPFGLYLRLLAFRQ